MTYANDVFGSTCVREKRESDKARHAPAGEEGSDGEEEAAKAPSTLVIRTSAARR